VRLTFRLKKVQKGLEKGVLNEKDVWTDLGSVRRVVQEKAQASLYVYKRLGRHSVWRLDTKSVLH